eukprot:TRINITY_DN3766_c3_g5_i3.p1 TRINITY_DN3766_c3_g5~~TRINITY_DN3766_c3_g5_i3.p1  ORF type:complete len:107 (-),score=30.04 TRINITY_DN3766_c3_g5_i3:325-645(-)
MKLTRKLTGCCLPSRVTAAAAATAGRCTAAPPALAAVWGASGANYHQGPMRGRCCCRRRCRHHCAHAARHRPPLRAAQLFHTMNADLPAFTATDSAGGSATAVRTR